MQMLKAIFILVILAGVAGVGVIHSGAYSVAADEPHWPLTAKLIEYLRTRSISVRSSGIEVPDLEQPALVAEGGAHYAAMCSGCHLAPGVHDTEIRAGLYPTPPDLSKRQRGNQHENSIADATRQFWVIKHGIKMTAMPAWGITHDDNAIWGLVAFLQKLPDMTPEAYRALALQPGSHAHDGEDTHATPKGKGHVHGEVEATVAAVAAADHHQLPSTTSAAARHHDAPGTPPHAHGSQSSPSDPREISLALHSALAAGDPARVKALLLPEVLIFESGAAETSAEQYAGHHMSGDMAFLAKLSREQVAQTSGGDSASAWIATRSRLTGQFGDRQVDLDSTETLVLRRTDAGWRVAHIHWSSAPHAGTHH